MKKSKMIALLLCFVMLMELSVLGVGATNGSDTEQGSDEYSYTALDNSVINGCHTIDAQKPLLGSKKQLESAQAAFLYEVNTDTVVYAWNPDDPFPPASLVKMLTALIAIEEGNMSDIVTVTNTALAAVPEFMHGDMGLVAGEQFTLEQLIHLMMVGSSNDASAVIAEHLAGSQGGFVVKLNTRAKELGCTGSNFTDAHGLSEKNQYTTARDMCRILREAMKSEKFMEFFATLKYEIPATPYYATRYLATTNYLMTPGVSQIYYDRRVTGGRTGVTNERFRSLAATSESGNLKYISIILCAVPTFAHDNYTVKRFGSYEETIELLKMAYSNMRYTEVLSEDQVSTQFPVMNGENNAVAGPVTSAFTVLPASVKLEDLEVRYEQNYASLNAPINAGDRITNIQMWYGNVCLAQTDLIAKSNVRAQGADPLIQFHQGKKTDWTMALMILGISAGIMLLFVLGIRLVNMIQRSRRNAQYKRRSAGRRRSR